LWLYNQAAGWLFLFGMLIATYGILKILGCMRPCYHCKKCTFGLGRIAALYFGKRDLKDYKETYGLAIAIFFFVLLGPFPAAILIISTVQKFALLNIVVLAGLLVVSLYSSLTWRPTRKF